MELFYLILLLLLAFQPVIGEIIPLFNYFDEGIAVASAIIYLLKFFKYGKLKKNDLYMVLLLFALIVVGVLGNTKSGLASNNRAIVEDIISFTKICFVYLVFSQLRLKDNTRARLRNYVYIFCSHLAIVMFVCALITQVYNFGMGHDPRHGLLSFRFIFENAPALNAFFYFLMPLFSCTIYHKGMFRKNATIVALMLSITWFLTLRSRAMAFSIIYMIVYLFIFNKPKYVESISIKKRYVLCGGVAVILLGWDAFLKYFVNNEREVRFIMSRMCIVLTRKFFPIGSGFATFGTEASRKYYSDTYSMLGISNVWGISQDTGARFILDQFWFGVVGQFGLPGLLIIGIIVFLIYKNLWKISKSNKGFQLATITFIFTTLIGSISAATYINAYAIATVVALYVMIYSKKD